jgi:hypothetical protein
MFDARLGIPVCKFSDRGGIGAAISPQLIAALELGAWANPRRADRFCPTEAIQIYGLKPLRLGTNPPFTR